MTLYEEQLKVQRAMGSSLAGLREDPWLAQRILANTKGDKIVKKKISASMIIAIAALCIIATAIAAGVTYHQYNQKWWWDNRNNLEKEYNPEMYGAVMANMTENPEQQQCEDDQVAITVQDASWAPEADTLTISLTASPKDPGRNELHNMQALDTDGSYIGEGGSDTVTDDSEDRAVHWLWRTDIGLEGFGGYNHIPGYGPVADMMDDRSKQLLLLDYPETFIMLSSPEIENVVDMFPLTGSMDMFRTTEGDVCFVGKYDLSWLREDYDQKMLELAAKSPDMKEYYDGKIAAARTARERISNEWITCYLTYRVVEYTEGISDSELYSGGKTGTVEFVIRPGQ